MTDIVVKNKDYIESDTDYSYDDAWLEMRQILSRLYQDALEEGDMAQAGNAKTMLYVMASLQMGPEAAYALLAGNKGMKQ